MAERAIIVHSLDHALAAAAAAAALGVPVTIASAPGAAAYLGAPWFRELLERVGEAHPKVAVTGILDCADRPGHVLAAVRAGLGRVRFTGRRATAERLRAIASASGAKLVTGRLVALDLLDEADPPGACRAWLAKGRAP